MGALTEVEIKNQIRDRVALGGGQRRAPKIFAQRVGNVKDATPQSVATPLARASAPQSAPSAVPEGVGACVAEVRA